MTVSYNAAVATSRPFLLVGLLFRWRGSFYKLIAHQFAVYVVIYITLNTIYLFVLNDTYRSAFDELGLKLSRVNIVGPVIFCLGFFVKQAYDRFWANFQQVPWTDAFAFYVSAYVLGHDFHGRILRRTIARYAVASVAVTLMPVSKFKTLDKVVEDGYLTEDEAELLKDIKPTSR